MLEWHIFQIFGLFILTCLSPPQQVPAMVGRHFVKPSRERTALVILKELIVAHRFREDIHGGGVRLSPGCSRPPAKAEDGGSILPVKLSPGIGIPCPCPSDRLCRLCLTWRAHPLWSRRIHRLVRSRNGKIIHCNATAL